MDEDEDCIKVVLRMCPFCLLMLGHVHLDDPQLIRVPFRDPENPEK